MTSGNTCIFCSSTNSRVLYPTGDIFGNTYTIRQCNDCRAYFLSPLPDEATLQRAYADDYYGERDEKFSPAVEKVLDFFRLRRSAYLRRQLAGNGAVLDIGCGNGRFLEFLGRHGNYKLYGTELKGRSAERAARISGITLKTGQLDRTDFAPETFDAITLFHVFEHLTHPKETLEIISSIIKKKGILIISFPNITSLQSHLFKGRWLHLDPPRHLFFFSPADFIALMRNYGFRLVKQNHFSVEQNPFGMVQSTLNLICRKRELLFERLKGNKQYGVEYHPGIILLHKLFFAITFPVFIITGFFAGLIRKGATVELTFRKM